MHKTSTNNLKILLLTLGLVYSLNVFAAYAIRSNEVMLLPPGCFRLSPSNKTLGMNDEARKILELGLKRVSRSKSLQRRLDKL